MLDASAERPPGPCACGGVSVARLGRRPEPTSEESFVSRVSPADRVASQLEPGSPDGPFRLLYLHPRESASEIRNATVHAFSVMALQETQGDYRLYWAIYVRPVGWFTAWYMALIDPFRRWLIYPTLLRRVRRGWQEEVAARDAGE